MKLFRGIAARFEALIDGEDIYLCREGDGGDGGDGAPGDGAPGPSDGNQGNQGGSLGQDSGGSTGGGGSADSAPGGNDNAPSEDATTGESIGTAALAAVADAQEGMAALAAQLGPSPADIAAENAPFSLTSPSLAADPGVNVASFAVAPDIGVEQDQQGLLGMTLSEQQDAIDAKDAKDAKEAKDAQALQDAKDNITATTAQQQTSLNAALSEDVATALATLSPTPTAPDDEAVAALNSLATIPTVAPPVSTPNMTVAQINDALNAPHSVATTTVSPTEAVVGPQLGYAPALPSNLQGPVSNAMVNSPFADAISVPTVAVPTTTPTEQNPVDAIVTQQQQEQEQAFTNPPPPVALAPKDQTAFTNPPPVAVAPPFTDQLANINPPPPPVSVTSNLSPSPPGVVGVSPTISTTANLSPSPPGVVGVAPDAKEAKEATVAPPPAVAPPNQALQEMQSKVDALLAGPQAPTQGQIGSNIASFNPGTGIAITAGGNLTDLVHPQNSAWIDTYPWLAAQRVAENTLHDQIDQGAKPYGGQYQGLDRPLVPADPNATELPKKPLPAPPNQMPGLYPNIAFS